MPCQQDSVKSKIGNPQDGQYNDILLLDLFLHRLTILLLFPLVSSFYRLLPELAAKEGLSVPQETIDGLTLEGDFFILQDPLPLLEKCLCGLPIQEDAFRKALADVDLGEYIYKLDTEDWIQLIFRKPDQK